MYNKMKVNSVMVKKPAENESMTVLVEEENAFKSGIEEREEHFDAIIKSYQSEIQKLHDKLQHFHQANLHLRKENIELRIKLSEYENDKELEVTAEVPNCKNSSHSRKLSCDSMSQEVQELKEQLIKRKQEYDSVVKIPSYKHIGRSVPNSHRKKNMHVHQLSEPLVLSACPSINRIGHHKKKQRSSKKHRTSKFIPSHTRNLKNNI